MNNRLYLFIKQCSHCRFNADYGECLTCKDCGNCKQYISGHCLCLDEPYEGEVSCIFYEPYKGGNLDNE